MPEKKTLFEEFTNGIANAIRDVREKVVEEGWFGKVVNERPVTELNFGWPQPREVQPDQAEPEHERDAAEKGMDR